jgi:hypothetical protein
LPNVVGRSDPTSGIAARVSCGNVFARGLLLANLVASSLAACGEPAARVQIAPIDLPSDDPADPCGKPAASLVNQIKVTAYTPEGEQSEFGSDITDFPSDTQQLGVQLIGGDGTVLAAGKTVPLDYGTLADGATIPIAMLPPGGFCRANDMSQPRLHPIVARAGDGVLVLGGGVDAIADFYDPTTARFTPIALSGALTSLDGASVATLTDGRVVIMVGQALIVFEPSTQTFTTPSIVFSEQRIEQASYGLDASHWLVAGGCTSTDGACDATASPLTTTLAYEIDDAGVLVGNGSGEPALPAGTASYGGSLFDVGTISDGSRRFVLAGATSAPTTADVIPLDSASTAAQVTGMSAQNVLLDSGALLTAFAPDGAPASGAGAMLPPEGTDGAAIATSFGPARGGARLVLAEDGTAIAIGGGSDVAVYTPTTDRWSETTPTGDVPGVLDAPSLVRLADGSVLVIGSTRPPRGPALRSTRAWLYRPSLVGPASGELTAVPDGTGAVLTPTAPAMRGSDGEGLILTAGSADDVTVRALVGGPRRTTGTLQVLLHGLSGGVALVAQQTSPGEALVARLVPGVGTTLERHDGATVTTLCTGSSVTTAQLETGASLQLDATTASVFVGNASAPTLIMHCDLASDPVAAQPGMWGVAVTAGGSVTIDSVDLSP